MFPPLSFLTWLRRNRWRMAAPIQRRTFHVGKMRAIPSPVATVVLAGLRRGDVATQTTRVVSPDEEWQAVL